MSQGPRTAEELMNELMADPEFRPRHVEREVDVAVGEAQVLYAEQPVLRMLAEVGLTVSSLWHIDPRTVSEAATLVLLEQLSAGQPPEVREGLSRALGGSRSRPHWSRIAALYESEEDPRVREGLAVALGMATTQERLPDLLDLTWRDTTENTVHFVHAFSRHRTAQARAWLESLAGHPVAGAEVRRILHQRELRRRRREKRA